ncbi:hypothetical protein KAU45_01340, partial [bacterium]|nr:hypothetical protein [bacterium]
MKRAILILVVVFGLLPVSAQVETDTPQVGYGEVLREAGFKLPRPKTTLLPGLIEEKSGDYAESQLEEEQPDTGEKIERATKEVGKALGPLGQIFQWFSDLPGYWEAFLVGGVCIVALLTLYSLVIFGVRRIMRKRGKPDWRLARRYAIFLRLLFLCISILVALAWIGETEG